MELLIHKPLSTENLNPGNVREAALQISRLIELSRTEIESGLWDEYK
jgi:hypothetical protein